MDYSVQVSAHAQTAPKQITLHWPNDSLVTPASYTIYRRAPGANSWGKGTSLPGNATSYVDSNVTVGVPYEYQVVRKTPACYGYGYIYAGINVPLTENRGKLLLVVDKTHADDLAFELDRLQQDLTGDGWTVTRLDVNRDDSPAKVKKLIRAQYQADPANVKAVFLFGRVPVPYSGDIVPDGHYREHEGAWPSDGYYADMDGVWTDRFVNTTRATDPRNHNRPGDGKFDQSTFPAPLKLMIGRVDLSNMPGRLAEGGPATFPSEVELLRNYLNKNHKFRKKLLTAPERAVVGDYFGVRDGEAFAASGWRNFAPFVGAQNITTLPDQGTWLPTLCSNAWLWAYGCGAGSYTSVSGIGKVGRFADGVTTDFVRDGAKAVFTMLYGSWLGDWDSEDNLQRAILATPDYGLTCSWSGRPHWFMQHMALGEPIGFSTLVTQNSGFTGLYRNERNNCAGWVHIALMGDPTLRMQIVAPPPSASVVANDNGAQLNWTPSNDAVEGYHLYRATNPSGPFTRVNPALVTGTRYTDANAAPGKYTYMVRAVKLERSASGTYFNLSEGRFATPNQTPESIVVSTNPAPVVPAKITSVVTPVTPLIEERLSPTGEGSGAKDTIWFDDSLPNGAIAGGNGGDSWNWVGSNPSPYSGRSSHRSNIAAGAHQHYFDWSFWQMLPVNAGDILIAYVYLDPSNVPSQIMLSWNDGSWNHRAYWGANLLTDGTDGTASRRYMGPLPAAGQWVRLEVPASRVNLEGKHLKGMAFSLYGGRAAWDYAGKSTALVGSGGSGSGGTTNPPPTTPPATNAPVNPTDSVWFDDALPAGAQPRGDNGDGWNWVNTGPAPFSGQVAHRSNIGSGLHQHYFDWASASMSVNAGDVLFAYAYIDPANVPSELMLQWNDGSWEHRAYWGANQITWGTDGTASRRYMGPLPAAGQWVRLEVPASQVGLEGSSVKGMAFTAYNGRVTWDRAGKANGSSNNPPDSGTNNIPDPGTNTPPVVDTNTPPTTPPATNTPGTPTDSVWFDDALPNGAQPRGDNGDGWNWVNGNPAPFSGQVAHQSNIGNGMHQHHFDWASAAMSVNAGEVLFAYAYIDPANVPSELMLQWNDGSWEHRAYWGANQITWGTDGTASRRYMGPLPAAGKWVRLEVPASQVGLEGSSVKGMAFTAYNGRVTWDRAGKANALSTNPDPGTDPGTDTNTPPVVGTNTPPVVSTNPPPTTENPPAASDFGSTNFMAGSTSVDNIGLRMPKVGDHALRVLSPTLLELKLINTKQPDPARVAMWDFVNDHQFSPPPVGAFNVTVNGQSVPVQAVGFKRRPLYAPLAGYDLRIENTLYLRLGSPVSDNQSVEVKNPNGSLWPSSMNFVATMAPLRYSPAIHVNQEGYLPNHPKKAMIGYYLGNLGEMEVNTSSGFKIVDANSGAQVHQGSLTPRPDRGYNYSPTPYQKVCEADFTGFNTPGTYRLVVPGLGASLPFTISDGVAMNFARTFALGLYHQRCGGDNAMPFTRFTHERCHHAPAAVPTSASEFPFTWNTIANYAQQSNPDNPVQTAPKLLSPAAQLFPFVRTGNIDVSGGHHDAGDYSKYTLNSVALIHYLMIAVDGMPGVAALDNLGIPESGDGISDILQEAKWEADFLAKMQDSDGGFYFLVYPQNREYESDRLPEHGDPQLVWPKTSTATAASVAALAQCASSPAFKQAYPAAAALYMQKAQLGWQFLMNGIQRYGLNGIYQKITHYGDDFADRDELAWAACEMYVATGDPQYQQKLFEWFPDPTNPATFRWGWWRLFLSYGNAVRSYAFAQKSGRLPANKLDANYLAKCQSVVIAAGDDMTKWSKDNAYGTSFPEPTKHVRGAGWYFSGDQAYDIAVAYQLSPKPDYISALLANMNYEGGCNPVNVSYVTGMGWKRQRDAVNQYALNDHRTLPPIGEPLGNVQSGFAFLWNYQGTLRTLCYPSDEVGTAPYPFYDRWGDSWNVSTEFVTFLQARSLAAYAFLASQTSLKSQQWKSATGQINLPTGTATGPVTLSMQAAGVDLKGARIVWEVRDEDPFMGHTLTYTPKNNGEQWVEAEAQLSDGRRIFARGSFNAESANTVWVDDALPTGATAGTDGGDSWRWTGSNPEPFSGQVGHESAAASGLHQHFFSGATSTMKVGAGTVLYAYIYLDPANPPSEVMLQWNDGSWEHRAYWGANNINYGTDGTASRRHMGPLPPAGQWVQLKVPASQVGLEGKLVNGMAFTLYGGRAMWDAAGVLNPNFENGGGTTANVTLSAEDASIVGPTPGRFTLTRTGDTSQPLLVSYSLGGTAESGVDYQVNSGSQTQSQAPAVTIPAGATSATVEISPTVATEPKSARTVVMTLASNASYSLPEPGVATVIIGGNTVGSPALQMGPLGPTLSWPSTASAAYRIAYKNKLTDPTWTYIGGEISSAGIATSWVDTNQEPQRFYLVLRTR